MKRKRSNVVKKINMLRICRSGGLLLLLLLLLFFFKDYYFVVMFGRPISGEGSFTPPTCRDNQVVYPFSDPERKNEKWSRILDFSFCLTKWKTKNVPFFIFFYFSDFNIKSKKQIIRRYTDRVDILQFWLHFSELQVYILQFWLYNSQLW